MIFKYELRKKLLGSVLWGLALGSMAVMYMAVFPTFATDAQLMDKMLANYPEAMIKAFGMDRGLSFGNILGFFAFTFSFIQLGLAVQGANQGFSILSVEESELTADFLIAKPISRNKIISSKFTTSVIALLITDVIIAIISIISIELFKDSQTYELKSLILLLGTTIMFQLFFVTIGMLVSVSTKKISSVISYSMGISFGTYIINAFKNVFDSDVLSYITPFNYFDPIYILKEGSLSIKWMIVNTIIIVASLAFSYYLYNKRNIHAL